MLMSELSEVTLIETSIAIEHTDRARGCLKSCH